MDHQIKELLALFEKTFEDRVFSRPEKKAIAQLIGECDPDKRNRDLLRSRIFDLAREAIRGHENHTERNSTRCGNRCENTAESPYISLTMPQKRAGLMPGTIQEKDPEEMNRIAA